MTIRQGVPMHAVWVFGTRAWLPIWPTVAPYDWLTAVFIGTLVRHGYAHSN